MSATADPITPCPGCGDPAGARYGGDQLCYPCHKDGAPASNGSDRPITTAGDIRKTRLRWTWRGRLALGYLAVWCGSGDIGKSMFAAWVIKQLNYGLLPGEFEGEPQSALIICTEDGRDDMWLPRLEAVGADLARVEFLDYPRGWNLKDGISWIDRAITDAGIPLVFVDALMSHMPEARGGENTRSPTFVRQALEPFADLCKERKITGLFGLHPRKAGGDTFADVVQESGVFTQLPRLGLLFGYHPDDLELPQEEQRRVIVRGKGNVGRNPGAISFRIAEKFLDWGDEDPDGVADGVGYITDVQSCHVTERQLLHSKVGGDRDVSKTKVAEEFITLALADGDWHEGKPIEERLAAMDITSWSVITTAKKNLGVKSRKRPGVTHGPWEWQIPHSSNSTPQTESWPPRATLVPRRSLDRKNGSNPNNDGKNPTIRLVERNSHNESQDSNTPSTTRARTTPGCSCADGPDELAPDGRCTRCWGTP